MGATDRINRGHELATGAMQTWPVAPVQKECETAVRGERLASAGALSLMPVYPSKPHEFLAVKRSRFASQKGSYRGWPGDDPLPFVPDVEIVGA